ncbi:hypothetical protein [Microbacterium sp. SORGH_AS_0888]|uniref:hypothetical protein n=1 Tax=Microbacterium sp. SORGH_AS_0888 TaxID=3041791 RepID=UPI00277E1CB2|nr:hypothetical protein [Microbacterium sp. SORGH_AS_0888]MDQ1129933.1 hypothetical protein [Microbacterium sp. SORGH_AS_0888]
MSFDIAVFDPALAPADEDALRDWLTGEHLQAAATPRLLAWEDDLRRRVPGYELAPEELPEGALFAGYSASGAVIWVSCTFSAAQAVETHVRELAVHHGVGVWAVSSSNAPVWTPPREPRATEPRRGFRLTVENLDVVVDPSEALVCAAVEWLDPGYVPGFLVLEKRNGDYTQVFGSADGVTLERRRWRRRLGRRVFRHEVAATAAEESGPEVDVEGAGRARRIRENERLTPVFATEILLAFLRGAEPAASVHWHDITAELGG